MKNVPLKQKYDRVLKQLHVCGPTDKPYLKLLLNYYHGLLLAGGK